MCSIQDSDIPLKKGPRNERMNRLCMKCQEQKPILITRVNDAFCGACFQVYITHKFRATIGKTKLVRDGELVLVAFSGGPSSSALLQLIQEGLSIRAHKKLRFKPGLIFIDEGAAVGLTVKERLANCERVSDIMKKAGFPFYIRSLEEGLSVERLSSSPINLQVSQSPADGVNDTFLNTDCDRDSVGSGETASVTLPTMSACSSPAFRDIDEAGHTSQIRTDGLHSEIQIYEDAENQLRNALNELKTVSAEEDFIRLLRHKILLEVAKTCGYSKVMLGNCGTQLAVRLLTDISTGRGAHAAMETSFADKRDLDVMFLRPLRDFSSKEVAMYNNLHKVDPVFINTLTTKGAVDISIEHLTEAFVTGLQADYPSTVSNIMRTGEKLNSSVERKDGDKTCAMCQGLLDTNVGASSAMSAVLFSQQISRAKKHDNKNISEGVSECCGEGDGQCHTTKKTALPSPEDVLANLCYGCRLVIKDMNDIHYLPEYVLKDVSWRTRRLKMQEDIQEFLLQDS